MHVNPDHLLPKTLDQGYRGHPAALWLFGVVMLVKLGIGFGTLLNGHDAAVNADGIPLDSYGPGAAQSFISMFAAWGLAQVTIGVVNLVVLVRYRALVPFMFALLLAEHLLRKTVFVLIPLERVGSPPGPWINYALVALMVIGLALALRWKSAPTT